MLLQCFQQGGCKAEISQHKLLLILGAIDTSKVKYKITIEAITLEVGRIAVDIVLVYCFNVAGKTFYTAFTGCYVI